MLKKVSGLRTKIMDLPNCTSSLVMPSSCEAMALMMWRHPSLSLPFQVGYVSGLRMPKRSRNLKHARTHNVEGQCLHKFYRKGSGVQQRSQGTDSDGIHRRNNSSDFKEQDEHAAVSIFEKQSLSPSLVVFRPVREASSSHFDVLGQTFSDRCS